MDETAFRERLQTRNLEPEAIERSVAMVRRFERFVRQCRPEASVDRATAGDVERFLEGLERIDDVRDVLAIARYLLLVHNDEALVAALERIDGADVPDRLSRKLVDLVGDTGRDAVFGGLDIPAAGASPEAKSRFMGTLVERLFGAVDGAVAVEALASGLHFVPREAFAAERERYLAAPDFDFFLEDEHRRYVAYLTELRDDGALYFTQPITDDVVEYIRDTPTCGGGVRDGDLVRTTKVPYQADRYLHETDERRKAWFYCHCPWARASLLEPEATVSARFCNCSAGFEKQYWDTVLDEPVRVDVVRSVLAGDPVCEFAVHLPASALSRVAG